MHEWSRSRERVEQGRARWGDGPWPRELLVAAGWTRRQLQRDMESGRLVRIRQGLYAPTAGEPAWDEPSTYLPFLSEAPAESAVSHESAGRVHRLWLPYPSDDRVHLTASGRAQTLDRTVRRHTSPLTSSEIVLVGGVPVTSIARTAVDLARGTSFGQALVPLCSALRVLTLGEAASSPTGRTLLTSSGGAGQLARARAALETAAARAARWPGSRVVARCLPYADPRCESPYEAWSLGELIAAGLAPEAIGLGVRGASGRLYYVDAAWPSRGVVGEADGFTKYGDDPRTVRERLAAERHRQRDLEDAGWVVVRWSAGERAAAITARVARVLAAADARPA